MYEGWLPEPVPQYPQTLTPIIQLSKIIYIFQVQPQNIEASFKMLKNEKKIPQYDGPIHWGMQT